MPFPVALLLAAVGLLYAVDALFIDKDGNVGIGTNSPSTKLDVAGTVHLGTGIAETWIPDQYKNVWIGGDAIVFQSPDGAKEYVRFTNGGNVGIGTDSPSTKLDVAGTLNVADTATFQKDATINGKVGIGTSASQFTLDVKGNVRLGGGIADSWFPYTDNIAYISGKQTVIRSDIAGESKEFLRIDQNGNVGIGTTDPGGNKLKVQGQTTITGDLYVDGWINNIHQGGYRRLESITSIVRGHDAVWTEDTYSSDNRLKTEIYPVPAALEKLRKLRGVTYLWNQEALDYFTSDIEKTISAGPDATKEANRALWQKEREKRYKELSKTNVGVIAQEVEAVLPEAVTTDEKGYKSVRYHYLIQLLIEALKEQDKAVKEQTQTVAWQQAKIESLTTAQQTLQNQLAELAAVKAQLARLEAALQRGTAARTSVVPDALRQAFTAQAK